MSYDVSANMVEAVFATIQTSAKTKSLPDNDNDDCHYCHASVTISKNPTTTKLPVSWKYSLNSKLKAS